MDVQGVLRSRPTRDGTVTDAGVAWASCPGSAPCRLLLSARAGTPALRGTVAAGLRHSAKLDFPGRKLILVGVWFQVPGFGFIGNERQARASRRRPAQPGTRNRELSQEVSKSETQNPCGRGAVPADDCGPGPVPGDDNHDTRFIRGRVVSLVYRVRLDQQHRLLRGSERSLGHPWRADVERNGSVFAGNVGDIALHIQGDSEQIGGINEDD